MRVWCCLWPHGCSGRRVACLDGPGRCVCRWAVARPRDRHTRACGSEWSISRPALALPPPTGTAARPRVLQLACALRSLRRPPHLWGWVADVWRCASSRSPARPSRRPRAPQPGPGPSGALHTGGAWSLMCGWVRRLEARPGPAAAHGRCSLVLRTPQCGLACRAGILGRSALCCYKRRQSAVFFVWISDPLLQTSSIRRLFR